MNVVDQIEIVKEVVTNYFANNAEWLNLSELSADEKSHIIQIGTSILCTKWQVGYAGGGFVQSFVNNDLMGAIGSADSTSYKGFKFFASLMYNVGAPRCICN